MIFHQLEVIVLDKGYNPLSGAKVVAVPKPYGPAGPAGDHLEAEFDTVRQLFTLNGLESGEVELLVRHPQCVSQQRHVQVSAKGSQVAFLLTTPEEPAALLGCSMVPLAPQPEMLAIIPAPEAGKGLLTLLSAHDMHPTDAEADLRLPMTVRRSQAAADPSSDSALRAVRKSLLVAAAGPLFRDAQMAPFFLNHRLLVRFRPETTGEQIEKVTTSHNLEFTHLPYAPSLFLAEAEPGVGAPILAIGQSLLKTGLVEYAQPELSGFGVVPDAAGAAIGTHSPLWPLAWDRHLAGVEGAWDLLRCHRGPDSSFGSPEVNLALVDQGVEEDHPDWSGSVSDGREKIARLFDFEHLEPDNMRLAGVHGLLTAGVATGRSVGVAPNCRLTSLILPLNNQNRLFDLYQAAAGLEPFPGESPTEQKPTGADIVSTSYGLNDCPSLLSEPARDLLDYLTRRGRAGKGCLLFFSAGNDPRRIVTGRPFGWYERAFSCAASSIDSSGREVRASYSGWGAVEWCAPSGSKRSPDRKTGELGIVSACHNYRGNLPTETLVSKTLTRKVNVGETSLPVGDTTGLVKDIPLSLERPGSRCWEIVKISSLGEDRNSQLINLSTALRFDHGAGALITSGLRLVNPDLVERSPRTSRHRPLLRWRRVPKREVNTLVDASGDLSEFAIDLGNDHLKGENHHREGYSGTSPATALCAGIGALVLSANPDLSWVEAREILRSTAVKIDPENRHLEGRWLDDQGRPTEVSWKPPFFSQHYGFGRLDAEAAVARALTYDSSSRDLMIRNDPQDDGTTDRPAPGDSPDIWIRRTAPAVDSNALPTTLEASVRHQIPTYGKDHWIYARIHNRGRLDGLEAWVRFYIASHRDEPFRHPEDWESINGVGNRRPGDFKRGTYFIGEVGLPRIPAGRIFVVNIRWPAALLPPREQDGEPWNPHLLVEINPSDGPLTGDQVHLNNNLAQKAIQIID